MQVPAIQQVDAAVARRLQLCQVTRSRLQAVHHDCRAREHLDHHGSAGDQQRSNSSSSRDQDCHPSCSCIGWEHGEQGLALPPGCVMQTPAAQLTISVWQGVALPQQLQQQLQPLLQLLQLKQLLQWQRQAILLV